MEIVILESPYAGKVRRNIRYARACIKDCLSRQEAAFASHLLYTQKGILNDKIPGERKLGLDAGWSFIEVANKSVVYTDLGISPGMENGIQIAKNLGKTIEYRTLPNWSDNVLERAILNLFGGFLELAYQGIRRFFDSDSSFTQRKGK